MDLMASMGGVSSKFEMPYHFPMAMPITMLSTTKTGRNLISWIFSKKRFILRVLLDFVYCDRSRNDTAARLKNMTNSLSKVNKRGKRFLQLPPLESIGHGIFLSPFSSQPWVPLLFDAASCGAASPLKRLITAM